MNISLQSRCELLVRNRETLQSVFKWNHSLMALTGATIFTGRNIMADPEILKECKAVLKQHAGVFSSFRGNLEVPLVCNMALSGDPDGFFLGVKDIYERMSKKKIFGSEYRLLAAMNIYLHGDSGRYDETILRAEELYRCMKDEHPFLTAEEDLPFAAMMAVTDVDIQALITDMEDCYSTLKPTFHNRNALQSLCQILSLSGKSVPVKCSQTADIYELLREKKHRYGSGYELASLGALTMLDMTPEQITDLIAEADDFLKKQKGFGDILLGASERRMFAALMVINTFKPESGAMQSAVLSSALAIVIAIEICILCCIAASSAAASS